MRLPVLILTLSALGIGGLLGKYMTLAELAEATPAPPVQACAPRQDLDKACVAWLFETDLGKAQDRICGRRK